jgi:CxxC motif-containing protein (DUF1111 family)
MTMKRSAVNLGVFVLGSIGLCVALYRSADVGAARADSGTSKPDPVAVGYEIFNREWLANDSRSHGGDGLGPVYNDSSCVACHNSGGSGGAGPVSKNIDVLSAARNLGMAAPAPVAAPASGRAQCGPNSAPVSLDPLIEVHAGFRSGRTVVLHKFGIDPNYESWRAKAMNPPAPQGANGQPVQAVSSTVVITGEVFVQQSNQFNVDVSGGGAPQVVFQQQNPTAGGNGEVDRAATRMQQARSAMSASNPPLSQKLSVGSFIVARSQRNPSPLFGLGLIDAIPDEALLAMEKREAKESPQTKGRVSRLKDGRIGRLGWKGQTANTDDFVLNACAVELGLEVPGHHQAMTPQAPKYQPSGLDLTAEECNALVAYVRSLPRPVERRPSSTEETKHIEAGLAAFASVGCANCHTPKLASVVGIYSDLLLHDMGQDLGDEGSYDGASSEGDDEPLTPLASANPSGAQPVKVPAGATRREWRTPPLWGFRDSGPYLHDGRAQTLEQAVALHGGQAQESAIAFFRLSPREQRQVESFLKSLVAPSSRHGD